MFARFFYALKEGWHYRQQLKSYVCDGTLQAPGVLAINLENLASMDIQVLVLDYDGVLAAHGELTPRAEVLAWLEQLKQKFAPRKIYILSNKPTPQRQTYFRDTLPWLRSVIGIRKKPYPDGLQQIIAETAVSPRQILMVDDRLGTGILAALIVGAQGCWITGPYINLRHRPFAEGGTMLLRWLERLFIICC